MWSRVASWRVPRVLTTVPLTWTRPSRMISSALRRLAMPAWARIFCRRSPLGSLSEGFWTGDLLTDANFLTAERLIAVGASFGALLLVYRIVLLGRIVRGVRKKTN